MRRLIRVLPRPARVRLSQMPRLDYFCLVHGFVAGGKVVSPVFPTVHAPLLLAHVMHQSLSVGPERLAFIQFLDGVALRRQVHL